MIINKVREKYNNVLKNVGCGEVSNCQEPCAREGKKNSAKGKEIMKSTVHFISTSPFN